jgi:hypothetical protein
MGMELFFRFFGFLTRMDEKPTVFLCAGYAKAK